MWLDGPVGWSGIGREWGTGEGMACLTALLPNVLPQHNRNSSGFSSSLRDALQKKISILEHQIQEKFNATEPHWHKPDSHGSEKGEAAESESRGGE